MHEHGYEEVLDNLVIIAVVVEFDEAARINLI
jgi:hypothetical protein